MVVAFVAGALAGAVAVLVLHTAFRRARTGANPGGTTSATTGLMAADTMLNLLPTGAVMVDASDNVLSANAAARRLGVVRNGRVTVPELRELIRRVRRIGDVREVELTLQLGGFPRRSMAVRGAAHSVGDGLVALVVDDLTEARRVDAVRRDFVANVGHEIKTPVGAMALLVEAALEAQDDPATVRGFLGRLQHEVQRLSRLVQELLDLSRLQGGEPLPQLDEVSLDDVVDEAVDRARLAAEAKQIRIVRGGDADARIVGSESQLVTALANLLDNAIAYSPEGTRVAVAVRRLDEVTEVSVTDQGIGIAPSDQERIFERFYRVDQSRATSTGGTGLGLAIVKHVASNHGGSVSVWSEEGVGSTFTLRIPLISALQTPDADDADTDHTGPARGAVDETPTAASVAERGRS